MEVKYFFHYTLQLVSSCYLFCAFIFFYLFVLLQWISLTLSSGLIRCVAFGPRAVVLLLYRRTTYEALGAIFISNLTKHAVFEKMAKNHFLVKNFCDKLKQ